MRASMATTSICLSYGSTSRVERLRVVRVAVDDAQEAVGVDLVFELAQQAIERADQTVLAVGAQLAGVEDRSAPPRRRGGRTIPAGGCRAAGDRAWYVPARATRMVSNSAEA